MNITKEELEEFIIKQNLNIIDYTEFTDFNKIFEGEHGTVYKSEWKKCGLMVAIKSFKIDTNPEKNQVQQFVRELQLLQKVSLSSHPNIIKFYGVTKDPSDESYKIILQFAEDGNLRDYLKKNFSELKWNDKIKFAKEIAEGLKFLHENDIAHRDLHPKNILVNRGNMMISDFGISKQFAEATLSSNSTIFAMPAYIEPQCIKDPKYVRNKKSDIYSLGFILWEISSGIAPFQSFRSADAIYILIYQGERETPVKGTPKRYIDLYTHCWDDDPRNRPVIEEVLETLDKHISMDDVISNDSQYLSVHNYKA